MLVYKFTTELEAQSARTQAADFKGLPVQGGTTLYWVDYQFSVLDNLYYIIYVDGLEEIFGDAEEFNITEENEI
jgi:hypothetical protein